MIQMYNFLPIEILHLHITHALG